MSVRVGTVGEFFGIISKTKILEAKEWIHGFKKSFPDRMWEDFARRALTPEAVESIVLGISHQAKRQIDGLGENQELHQRLCVNLEELMDEIEAKSKECRVL